ncbi:MAG: cation:proton antiporter subunit C [Candidatus Methylomirabilia bacterium]
MTDLLAYAAARYNYWIYIALMMIGFYAMVAHGNLFKKVIGMNIFQTAIILFFLSTSAKRGGTLPIISHEALEAGVAPAHFMNPLPHALMLTAIVVMVATLGVALAVLVRIYRAFGSFEEDVVVDRS